MKDILKIFDANKSVYSILLNPKDNTIIDTNKSFKDKFNTTNFENKTLRECIGCNGINGKECPESIFSKGKKNITHIVKCNHFKKNFLVRYFETKFKNNNYDVLIFDDFESNEANEQLHSRIDNIFSHEIKNITNNISLINQTVIENNDNEVEVKDFSKLIARNLDNLNKVMNSYFEHKKKLNSFQSMNSGKSSLKNILDELINYELFKIKKRNLKINFTHDDDSFEASKHIEKYDKTLLFLMLSNLIKNSTSYAVENTEITVIYKRNNNVCSLSIENAGILPESLKEHFFSKDKVYYHNSSGYGLFFSKYISEILGIDMFLENKKNKISVKMVFN